MATALSLPILAALLALAGCVSLPTDYPRTETQALTDTAGTRARPPGGRRAARTARHPGGSGVRPLRPRHSTPSSRAWRWPRPPTAASTCSTYIWHADHHRHAAWRRRCWRAADRGVRVRLLARRPRTPRPNDLRPAAARRAPEHRGAAVQSVRVAQRQPHVRPRCAQFGARQPAHAQQVVYRRQPHRARGRAQLPRR
ncbi:MAG: hypothetical protein MZV65_18345 [Chromatiales bacterium]|nr:hypothetical protein [Chromatiales bacterium]